MAMIMDLGSFLDWYSTHNTLVIQLLAGFIILLIIIFIYRLFFTVSEADGSMNNINFQKFEDKLTQIIDQHSQQKAHSNHSGTQMDNGMKSGNNVDSAAFQEEIEALKGALSLKDKEINDFKNQSNQGAELTDKIKKYEVQIDELKNRLSDYEIIAEDIADLQKYKNENDELKKQLADINTVSAESMNPVMDTAGDISKNIDNNEIQDSLSLVPEINPELTPNSAPALAPELTKSENANEKLTTSDQETSNHLNDANSPIESVINQNDLESLLSQASGTESTSVQYPEPPTSITTEPAPASQQEAKDGSSSDVSQFDEEKEALDEFEKIFEKEKA